MAMNISVGFITLAMLGFIIVWARVPGLRTWMESPKHGVLDWDNRKRRRE